MPYHLFLTFILSPLCRSILKLGKLEIGGYAIDPQKKYIYFEMILKIENGTLFFFTNYRIDPL